MKLGNRQLTSKDIPKAALYVLVMISAAVINASWIKVTLFGLMLFILCFWAVSIRLHRRTSRRVFMYMLAGVLIFTILFATSEVYMLRTAGYHPTFNPSQPKVTISRSTILDTSVGEIIQGIKNTSAFSILSLEYPGENILKYIELNTLNSGRDGGQILVRYHHSTTIDFSFRADRGRPYEVTARPWNVEFPAYIQPQTVDEALQQIDDLGLQWFYDQTVEEHQNKTGTTPEITDIKITITWDTYKTYQGLILSMTCFYENNEPRPAAFASSFQPNGTLLL
ncbi:hypothetical protein [Candidatus Bathycorpusculum sp.]|uniref:hypothetical protein n=1 Tax=Candidatus Bathycorpusculum sp. TaxID=2994959 RepID=UPI0028379525|nr:hypothetical protein [Candidatus Termitimicrobium sp.]MCL2686306.1 hypothetical protein [Candidatus Termitimicrobium sp.]